MWRTVKISDVCEFQSGLWKGKKAPFTKANVIRNTNFRPDGNLSYKNIALLEVETKELAKRELKYGDIILEKSGGGEKTPVGRVCLFENKDDKTPFSLSNFTCFIRVKESSTLDYKFLHKFLYFMYVTGKTEPMQRNSTGIRNLQLKEYKDILIPLPAFAEQKRIAAKLDVAFFDIDKTINLIRKKEREINALNATILFNEFRLSSETKKLSEVCKIYNGGTPSTKNKLYWGGNNQWLTPRDMGKMSDENVAVTLRQLTDFGLKNSSANLIPINSVILSSRAPIGHLAINDVPMAFNQGCKGLVPNPILMSRYLYYFLLSSKKLLNDLGTGTTFKEISSKKLSSIEINVPSLDVQKKIINKFDLIFSNLKIIKDVNKKQIENYTNLINAMIGKEIMSKAS